MDAANNYVCTVQSNSTSLRCPCPPGTKTVTMEPTDATAYGAFPVSNDGRYLAYGVFTGDFGLGTGEYTTTVVDLDSAGHRDDGAGLLTGRWLDDDRLAVATGIPRAAPTYLLSTSFSNPTRISVNLAVGELSVERRSAAARRPHGERIRGRRRKSLHDHLLDLAGYDDRGTRGVDPEEPAWVLRGKLLERCLDRRVKRLRRNLETVERQLLRALTLRGRGARDREVQRQVGPDITARGGVEAKQICRRDAPSRRPGRRWSSWRSDRRSPPRRAAAPEGSSRAAAARARR